MTDIDDRRDNPVYQRSAPEPKYKEITIGFSFEDDANELYDGIIRICWYEHNGEYRFVSTKAKTLLRTYRIGSRDLNNIIESAIREELGISLHESVIFESKIEIL